MMDVFVMISQAILYVSLAILIGAFTLTLVPESYRPTFLFPRKALIVSIIILPIVAFLPVLSSILYISPRLGFVESFKIVVTTYTIGLAWTIVFLLASIMLLLFVASIRQNKLTHKGIAFLQLVLSLAVIVMIAWSSHASSVNPVLGTISDFVHLLSVSLWAGMLIVIGFYATSTENWSKFLVWFSVLAATCLGGTAISGFLLADILINDYVNAWIVSYGQGIFLKHLFIIPLVFYAALNGFYVKYKLTNDPKFNPIPGVKMESFILMTIFILTAIFTQFSPPHGHFISKDAISPLFKLFHDTSNLSENSYLKFKPSGIAIAFVFASAGLVGALIISFIKKAPIWLLFIISSLLVVSIYSTFMISVQLS